MGLESDSESESESDSGSRNKPLEVIYQMTSGFNMLFKKSSTAFAKHTGPQHYLKHSPNLELSLSP